VSECFGKVSEEEGMEVHIERQRQAVGLETAWQEIEVSQESFAGVEAGAGVVTGGADDGGRQAFD
jgi:hypothetical protein